MSDNNQPAEPIVANQVEDVTHEDLLAKFTRWGQNLDNHYGIWKERATNWYKMRDGWQWGTNDIEALAERGKIPVTFDLISPTLDAVSGAEIQNRQQVQYFPREVGDTGVADALTQGASYLTDESNGDQEDSEAFRDVLCCGVGVVEYKPEVIEDDVRITKERIDPLEVLADPNSRRANYEDARYIRREIPMSIDEFNELKEELGRPDAEAGDNGIGSKRPTIVDPRVRYKNGMLGSQEDVSVFEWQWWENEAFHLTAIPQADGTTQLQKFTPEEHDQAQQVAQQGGLGPLKSQQGKRKVFYRAIVGSGEILHIETLEENAFRFRFITGKRDRETRTYYGLVRAMEDPQRFTNKLYSEIMHIVRTNAKGGLIMEEGAVKDIRQFEESYAMGDAITWAEAGALSNPNGPRMQPKVAPPIPPALFQLMEFAKEMVRTCTGVNEEILGIVGREQAGVLEHQRKQAAYGILSPYFDSLRRYYRDSGRLLLKQIRCYLPQDKLVRVVDKGTAQYVPLAETMQAQEYDVVVDESPSGPNQKARVMASILGYMPYLAPADLDEEFWGEIAQYMDVPASVSNIIGQAFKRKAEQAAQASQQQQPIQEASMQLDMQQKQSETAKNQAAAELDAAKAQREGSLAVSDLTQGIHE